ncbi:MAG: hypothetical protein OEV28_14205, partial [Nitrospirota bacterium]|nr:hypothetical protein [Nitrospirota bacterium]
MTRILSGAFCALIILSALFLPGCSSLDVTHKLAPDFESAAPVKVAVLGAAWQDKEDETANDGARVGGLISDLAQDKAMSLGYSTVRAEGKAHDAKRALDAEQYAQTARSLSVDAVLVPIIAGWERSAHIAGYVSFAFEASFTL